MKFKVWLNSGANIHSTRTITLDLEKDLGMSDEEWNDMDEESQEQLMKDIAFERSDWGYTQL